MANRQLLSRATEGTAAPTPGYLYKDLAQAASSNPSACQETAQYLTQRLQSKNNPNIKFKCLKVIAKLCDMVPRNQFRRCISQHPAAVAAIKESLNFRGPLDPVCGDEPNQKVRQAAQEALDAVYRESTTSELAGSSGHAAGGYGSSSMGGAAASYGPPPHASGGGYGGAGAGRRMEGIGNPRYQDPRLDPRWNAAQHPPANFQEAMREAGEVVKQMIKDPLARHVDHSANGGGVPSRGIGELPGYGGPSPPSQYGRPPPGASELSRQTGGQWTMASNRGPGAVQPPTASPYARENQEYYKARDTSYQWAGAGSGGGGGGGSARSGGVGGSWATASAPAGGVGGGSAAPHSTPTAMTSNPHSAAAPVSDGSYEKNLVLELCPPGGMKAVPPPDKLANFTKVVPSLNSDLVCPVLLDCLEEGQPWIIRAKALCVMETCLVSGTRQDGSNPYRDFFHACADEIMPLAAHSRAAIHDPTKRVLALLGVDLPAGYAAAAGSHGQTVAAAPAAAAPNLLDFDDGEAAPAPAAPPPQSPPSAAAQPSGAAAGAPSSSSLFGGMTIKTTGSGGAPAAPAPSGDSSLLDSFAPQEAAAAAAAAGNTDIFRDMGVKQQNGSANPPSSMFDQMNLKDNEEKKKTDSEDAGDVTSLASGSAFGFINETKPSDGAAAATAAPPPPPPPAGAGDFDPLKKLTPDTVQKKMMQVSPEQMQAMAYQQMMMQQHQMQMQRAYAMAGQQFPAGMVPGMPMPGMPMPPFGMNMQQQKKGVSLSMNSGARPAKKDDKKFDFVKDAMQTECHKK